MFFAYSSLYILSFSGDAHSQFKNKHDKKNDGDKSKPTRHISHKELKSKTDKNINIQVSNQYKRYYCIKC